MSDFVDIVHEGAIAILTLNSPEDRNALSRPEQCYDLVNALQELNADQGVRVAILTGAGSAFCAGGNIKDMKAKAGFMAGTPTEMMEGYRTGLQQIPLTFQALEVPIIAAVNGPAMGAGLDIASMCDLRICSSRAKFAEVFVRLGLISGIGGAWYLPRVLGPARAAELAYTARVIDGATALDWGLVSRVTAPEVLMDEARALAAEIAEHPGYALRAYKRLMRGANHQHLAENLETTAALQALAHTTAEHSAAVDVMLARLNRKEG